jgi:predicted aldo/keto reductase-like oxidoreductase
MHRTHGAEWWSRWHCGIPEYLDIPGQINVKEILRLWSFATSLDLVDWARMRYNLLGQADHWFPGENAARVDPALLRPVLTRSEFAQRIPEILSESHRLLAGAKEVRLSQAEREN